MTAFHLSVPGLLLILAGCSTITPLDAPRPDAVGVDGLPCVGTLPERLPGLAPVSPPNSAPNLQSAAQLPSGKGGVCLAETLKATQAVVVYRVFDSQKAWTQYGSWWALTPPQGPRDAYRQQNAICPEWSSLDRLTVCDLKPATDVVVGTTQSATCADGQTLPKTADLQVYVPNDSRNNVLWVENCRDLGQWP